MATRQSLYPNVMTGSGSLKHVQDVLQDAQKALHDFDVVDPCKLSAVSCEVAVYVNPIKEVRQKLGPDTLIMVAGVLRKLKTCTYITWSNVESLLTQCVVVTADSALQNITSDVFKKEGDRSEFIEHGRPTFQLLREIKAWLVRTINDDKVVDELDLNVDVFGRIIAMSKLVPRWLPILLDRQKYEERSVMDLGVLRFPDGGNEYFQLYKLEILAYVDVKRSGIYFKYTSKRYSPRTALIGGMLEDTKKKAIAEAVEFYTSAAHEPTVFDQPATSSKSNTVEVEYLHDVMTKIHRLETVDVFQEHPVPVVSNLAVVYDPPSSSDNDRYYETLLSIVDEVNTSLKTLRVVNYDEIKKLLRNLRVLQQNEPVVSESSFPMWCGSMIPEATRKENLWFQQLVNDDKVMEDLRNILETKALSKCLNDIDERVKNMIRESKIVPNVLRKLVDVTVLRYPNDHGYEFQLYNLQLSAFVDGNPEKCSSTYKCGLVGLYKSTTYGLGQSSRKDNVTENKRPPDWQPY